MARNWRSTKWKDFSKKKRVWFSILSAELVIALIAAGLCGAEVIIIPNWVAGVYIFIMAGTLYKFMNQLPELFVDTDDADEESDE